MAKKKPPVVEIRTISDMQQLPLSKIDGFCEDLRLWLCLLKLAADNGMVLQGRSDVFSWIDDGRHEINVNVHVHSHEEATSADAVDPNGGSGQSGPRAHDPSLAVSSSTEQTTKDDGR